MKFVRTYQTIKINVHGGILPTGKLEKILSVLSALHIDRLKFGLRQNIFIEFASIYLPLVENKLMESEIDYQLNDQEYPNVMSSYPAQSIFPSCTWLSEGVFKDILDNLDYPPTLKINIADSIQTLTPVFTGNINWIASELHPHYWHLYIRFPKTNTIIKWKDMVYTNDLMRFSKTIEACLVQHKETPIDQIEQVLIENLQGEHWNQIVNDEEIQWQVYSLPYYEGLNKYHDHYWLGIYRRDEWFNTDFLQDLCKLCQDSHLGEICITPWKSIIVKNIADADRMKWNHLLNYHHINSRHGLNELNFQIEDNNSKSLRLKQFIVDNLNEDDVRTQGICFGIKSKPKTEVFSNILIRKRHLINLGKIKALPVYDILLAKDFNPHERTGLVYRNSLFSYLLPGELSGCIREYYRNRIKMVEADKLPEAEENRNSSAFFPSDEEVYQCQDCKTIVEYETDLLGGSLECPVCGAGEDKIKLVKKSGLF